MPKAILKVRVFKPEVLSIDSLKIKALRLIKEEWNEIEIRKRSELISALYSVATTYSFKFKKHIDDGIVEATAEGIGIVVGDAEGSIKGANKLLWPSVSKLLRVGVIKGPLEKIASLDMTSGINLNENIEWHDISREDEIFIFEGDIEAPEDVVAVVLKTEDGERIIALKHELEHPVIRRKKTTKKRKKKSRKKTKRSKSRKKQRSR